MLYYLYLQFNKLIFKMSSRKENVFIEDHEGHAEEEEACDRKIDNNEEDQNNSNEHQNGYEQLDQLLDDENQSKQEIVLRFKVNELQKICNSLTNTNRKLIDKLTVYQEERQEREANKREEIFVDQYSELNGDFTQVQSLIQQYKQSLEEFQKNVLLDMKLKEEKMIKVKIEFNQIIDENNLLAIEKQDLTKMNKQLETRNQGLILEIQNLQKEKNRLQQRLSHKQGSYGLHQGLRHDAYVNDDQLPYQIQNQYELLIDKLVKQLEHQRNIKKKMNDQIRRMSQQLMESERQIMDKNKKLYEIQMKLLRSSKTTADTSVNYSKLRQQQYKSPKNLRHQQITSKQAYRSLEKADQKPNFKTFVLLQLINGELDEEINNNQKKIVGIKVIQFYERKLQRQDYSNVMPQNLLIYNFSKKKPQLMSVRKVGTSAYEEGEKTQQSLIWNLAFILDNLFGQSQGIEEFNQVLQLTGQILQKQLENNREVVQDLKDLLSV